MKTLTISLVLTVMIFVDILAQERNDANSSSAYPYKEPTPNEQGLLKEDTTGVKLDWPVISSKQNTSEQRRDPPLSAFISTVKNCYSRDKDVFSKCLMNFWKKTAPLKSNGIPELNIPQLDPIDIPKLEVSHVGTLVEGRAVITDVVFKGFSKFVPKDLNVDLDAKTISIELFFPHLIGKGNYIVNGVVMLLPIKGNGAGVVEVHGVDVKIAARVVPDGATRVRLAELRIEYDFKNATMHLSNLYGGKGVTEIINDLINDNIEELHIEVEPIIRSKFEEGITRFVSGMVKILPVDYIFPPEGIAQLFASATV